MPFDHTYEVHRSLEAARFRHRERDPGHRRALKGRIKLLVLGTTTTAMILGASLVAVAPAAEDDVAQPAGDRAEAVAAQVTNVVGGGAGRYLPK